MTELSVIVPVFNEKKNVRPLVDALESVLAGIAYEVVFVDDDSPDGTAAAVRAIAQTDPRVRVIQRIRRRGLSSAVMEGLMSSSSPYLAVIDGDMQHDERILPRMLSMLKAGGLDLVIGSRNAAEGSMGEFSRERVALSHFGRRLSRLVCKEEISDPMSGFFAIDRKFLEEVVRDVSGSGFKILLDLMASAKRPVRFAEVGYTFRRRSAGESKLDTIVVLEYLKLVLDKLVGDWVPVTFALFSMVGGAGVLIYLAIISVCLHVLQLPFRVGAAVAGSIVIAINFVLNNLLTYRSRRLRGWQAVGGIVIFYLGCCIGLAANVWVSDSLRATGVPWALAAVVGIVLSSVWNYWVTSVFVWRVNL